MISYLPHANGFNNYLNILKTTVSHCGFLYVCTATVVTDSSVHLVNLSSNGDGELFLSANSNTHYVAIDSDNDIQAVTESEVDNVS